MVYEEDNTREWDDEAALAELDAKQAATRRRKEEATWPAVVANKAPHQAPYRAQPHTNRKENALPAPCNPAPPRGAWAIRPSASEVPLAVNQLGTEASRIVNQSSGVPTHSRQTEHASHATSDSTFKRVDLAQQQNGVRGPHLSPYLPSDPLDSAQRHQRQQYSQDFARKDQQSRRALSAMPPKAGFLPPNKWTKVRPENDLFGKEAAKVRKTEHKKLVEIAKQGGENEFGHLGVFMLGDQMVTSPDIIVQSLKELAQHRSGNATYVRESNAIEVVAPELQTAQVILSRARGMVLGSNTTQDQISMVLVDSPDRGFNLANASVRMLDAVDKDATPKAAGLEYPPKSSKKMPALMPVPRSDTDFPGERRRLQRNALAIQVATTRTLHKLVFSRATITMRIYFGALIFERYQWEDGVTTESAMKFIEGLKKPMTLVNLYRLSPVDHLYGRFLKGIHLLAPYRHDYKIADTPPSFTGNFVWMKNGKADRIYEVATDIVKPNSAETPQVLTRGWITPHAPGTHRALSVSLTQMNGGVSCALQIHTEEKYVPPTNSPLTLTAQVTTPMACDDYGRAASRGELLFKWRATDCDDFKQRTIWRYRVKADQAYILELTRYDAYNTNRQLDDRRPCETRWDASLYHEDWYSKFMENRRMKPGERASWDPSADSFFPAEDPDAGGEPGVPAGLVIVIGFVRDFLASMNREDLHKLWKN